MNLNKDFISSLTRIIGNNKILLNESMKKHTSFKIGGCADIVLLPRDYKQVADVIKLCNNYEIKYFVMGNGSNLLVSDKGVRGVVIKTVNCFNKINIDKNLIECESGVLLSKLANSALQNSLTGLEFASGIPGTLGGAVIMNAGAYGGEMKDIVIETKYIDNNGNIKIIYGDEHKFGYRTSILQGKGFIIVNCKLLLKYGNKENIKGKMTDLNKRRREKQPLDMPSGGSVFKRPEGYFAGKLIQDSNLKGYSIGGAQVSEKHCGFIVNKGDATAQDVIKLIEYIQDTVNKKFGVKLEPELKIIGDL